MSSDARRGPAHTGITPAEWALVAALREMVERMPPGPALIVAAVNALPTLLAALEAAEAALRDIDALVDGAVDVRDGTDGPRPNLAMQVQERVRAALPFPDVEEVDRGA